jgi:hypothetical protein
MSDSGELQSNVAANFRSDGPHRRHLLKMGAGALFAGALLPAAPLLANDTVNKASQLVIEKMSNALLGDIGGPLASGKLVELLGVGESGPDYAAYFEAIQNQLTDIKAEITFLQDGLDRLSGDVREISSKVDDVTMQASLRSLTKNANLITENFGSYRRALSALQSTRTSDHDAAARQLFDLYSLQNMQQISIAMRNVQDIYLPQLSQQTGLIALQQRMIENEIDGYAQDSSHFAGLAPFEKSVYGGDSSYLLEQPSNNEGWFQYAKLLPVAHDKASALLDDIVADTLRLFTTLQLQGMVLLSSGWSGTINSAYVESHAERNKKILAKLAAFPADTASVIDRCIGRCLQKYGKRVGEPLKSMNIPWMYISRGSNDKVDDQNPFDRPSWNNPASEDQYYRNFPLSDDWIMWEQVFERAFDKRPTYITVKMVRRPWEMDGCVSVGIVYVHQFTRESIMYVRTFNRTNVAHYPATARGNLGFLTALA